MNVADNLVAIEGRVSRARARTLIAISSLMRSPKFDFQTREALVAPLVQTGRSEAIDRHSKNSMKLSISDYASRLQKRESGENRSLRPKISYLMWVYNEEGRVGDVLAHAVQWADEVLILCKPCTDRTREICSSYAPKVTVIDVPFSPQGHDDWIGAIELPSNDWIWVGTASEIPTRQVVRRCIEEIARSPDLDLVYVPRKMYSFGFFDPKSPWGILYYPFLFHRRRVMISNRIHRNIEGPKHGRSWTINFSDDCCVHHFTHTNAAAYVGAMGQYFQAERQFDDSSAAIEECLSKMQRPYRLESLKGTDLFGLECAWAIYWLGTALNHWEKQRGIDAKEVYRLLRARLVGNEWSHASDLWNKARFDELLRSVARRDRGESASPAAFLGAIAGGTTLCRQVKTALFAGSYSDADFGEYAALFRCALDVTELRPRRNDASLCAESGNVHAELGTQIGRVADEIGGVSMPSPFSEPGKDCGSSELPRFDFVLVSGDEGIEICLSEWQADVFSGVRVLQINLPENSLQTAAGSALSSLLDRINPSLLEVAAGTIRSPKPAMRSIVYVNRELLFLLADDPIPPSTSRPDPERIVSSGWSKLLRLVVSRNKRKAARKMLEKGKTAIRKQIALLEAGNSPSDMRRYLKRVDRWIATFQTGLKNPEDIGRKNAGGADVEGANLRPRA